MHSREREQRVTGNASDDSQWELIVRRCRSRARCPYCLDEVTRIVGIECCSACRARHHARCFQELGRCGACGQRDLLVRVTPRPGRRGAFTLVEQIAISAAIIAVVAVAALVDVEHRSASRAYARALRSWESWTIGHRPEDLEAARRAVREASYRIDLEKLAGTDLAEQVDNLDTMTRSVR